MVGRTPFAVLADRGHSLRIGKHLHRLRNRLHPLNRDHHGHGLPVVGDRHGMIGRLLNHGREILLCSLDCVGIGHA